MTTRHCQACGKSFPVQDGDEKAVALKHDVITPISQGQNLLRDNDCTLVDCPGSGKPLVKKSKVKR